MRNMALVALQFALVAFLASHNPSARSDQETRGKTHGVAPIIVNTPVTPRDNLLDESAVRDCRWVSDGAIDGEEIEPRLERLRTAIRLAEAELRVSRAERAILRKRRK